MTSVVDQVRRIASLEASRSSLPGYFEGPADAARHIIGSAELRRRVGLSAASNIVNGNEWLGRFRGHPPELTAMDNANNAIGLAIGARATTFPEVVILAREAIAKAIATNGSGVGGSPVWLSESRWSEPRDRARSVRDRAEIAWHPRAPDDPTYAFGGSEFTLLQGSLRSREEQILATLAGKSPTTWSDGDVRVVIRSRAYQTMSDPDHAAWQQRVRAYFDEKLRREQQGAGQSDQSSDREGGSVVQVTAHIRDGHPVTAHQRAAPG